MNSLVTVVFRVGLVSCFVVFSYLMLSKPTGDVHGLINDKVAHFIGFFALAFVMEGAFPKTKVLWKLSVLFGYGLLIEIVQLQLAYRHFSWWDWVADICGALAYQPLVKPVNLILLKLFPDKNIQQSKKGL